MSDTKKKYNVAYYEKNRESILAKSKVRRGATKEYYSTPNGKHNYNVLKAATRYYKAPTTTNAIAVYAAYHDVNEDQIDVPLNQIIAYSRARLNQSILNDNHTTASVVLPRTRCVLRAPRGDGSAATSCSTKRTVVPQGVDRRRSEDDRSRSDSSSSLGREDSDSEGDDDLSLVKSCSALRL